MDLNKALRAAAKTGKLLFGADQAKKAIETKEAKLIILASNSPNPELKEQKDVPFIEFPGTNIDLGGVCGKPFAISAVTVLEAGDSQILAK
ncbi:MAG: 50S ribosomal protein L30e [Thermoplasmata archaeon]|nr:50S ribosomal protein L30e [Thermoplasmata archaeon]